MDNKENVQPKKKNPIIIILIIILIILAIVIGVTSILLLSNKEVEEKETKSTSSRTTKVTSTIPLEGSLFEKNNIGVKISSINMNNVYDDTKAISIALSIINNNSYIALPKLTEITINNKNITETRLVLNIQASEDEVYGIKGFSECDAILYIDKAEYNSLNIKEIESISFKLSITNEDSWKKTSMLENELINISKEDIKYNNTSEYPEKLVYNQNDIKLSYVQVSINDIRFYIENNTNQDINIKAYDVYIDNKLQDGDFWDISLPKGKKKYSPIFTSENYLYLVGNIKDFRLKLLVTDKDNKELFRTNEIKVLG